MLQRIARRGFPIAALTTLLLVATAAAGVPLKMNYQVMLTNESDQPLPGQHLLVFRIVDAEIGGTVLWSEAQTLEANSIGVISAVVGSETPIDIALPETCWLEVEVDGEAFPSRRELVSSPYALRAADADRLAGLDAGAYALQGHDHDADYVNEGQSDAVTAAMIVPDVLVSLDGVTNDGGDIDLIAGSNIAITPDDAANTITIAAMGGDDGDWTQVNGDIYRASGFVGIGLSTPGAALDVSGTARLTGFTLPTGAAEGHVLTSDTTGVGTWQAPASGGITSVVAGDGLVGGGDVGDITLDVQAGGGLAVISDEVRITERGVGYDKLADTLSIASTWTWQLADAYVDAQISTEGPAVRIVNSAGAGNFGDCMWIGSDGYDASSDTDVLLADTYNGRVASFEKYTDDDQYAVWIAGASSGSEGLYVDGTIVSTGGMARGLETTRGRETLFCVEAPRAEVYASGTSRLEDGNAYVTLDRLFQEAISTNSEIRVTVTPIGAWSALYVESKTGEGFRVRSAGGDESAAFDWVACAPALRHAAHAPTVVPETGQARKKQR